MENISSHFVGSICQLPSTILSKVFFQCSPKTLFVAQLACKHFASIINTRDFWQSYKKIACSEKLDVDSTYQLSQLIYKKREDNDPAYTQLLISAANKGHPVALHKLGLLIRSAEKKVAVSNTEELKAIRIGYLAAFNQAANAGNQEALYELGSALLKHQDFDNAIPRLKVMAKKGHASSCYKLGRYYVHEAEKLQKNSRKAASLKSKGMKLLKEAALKKHPKAFITC